MLYLRDYSDRWAELFLRTVSLWEMLHSPIACFVREIEAIFDSRFVLEKEFGFREFVASGSVPVLLMRNSLVMELRHKYY